MDSATQAKIMRSATSCFERLGYKKTSIDSIAEGAGVAKGTIYLYCESKSDLFYQAVMKELQRWVTELAKHIDPRRPAAELLVEMGAADLAFAERHPLVRDLLFGLYHGMLPDWSERFEALRALGRQHVEQVLRLGIHQGAFAPDLDVEATASVLQEMQLAGVLLGHRTAQPPAWLARQRRAAVRLVIEGLQLR